jgi:hopene-associated glycosyltransferase HpnB
VIIAACIVLGFWALLALDRKRWWPGGMLLDRSAQPAAGRAVPSLVVVIPARNEAEVLRETLPALLAQSDSFARLVLVDDRSTDDTRAIAESIRATAAASSKVSIVEGAPPAAGWTGKLGALAKGLASAGEAFDWVLFTDADILHPPGSIGALLAKAELERRDLVSVMVRLRADSFWERLLIPPFVWFFQLLYPFRRVADPRSRVAAAAGGCVLLRREVLERAGGLEAIRGAIIDDVALASRVKKAGGNCWLGLDADMLSIRRYTRLREIVDMVARTAFHQLDYRYSLVAGTFIFLGLFFAAPPVLAICAAATGQGGPLTAALLAWGIGSAAFLPAVRHHRVSSPYALTLPVAALFYAYMTGVSAWRHLRGKGVEWKGRQLA